MRNSMRPGSRFWGRIHPYVARSEPVMVQGLEETAARLGVPARIGLTASNSGFFACQGRDVARVQPSVPELDRVFSEFDPRLGGQRIENMEMEASFLLHFLGGLGHWAGAICPTIANRRWSTFDHQYQESIARATEVGLMTLASLRKRYPDARLRCSSMGASDVMV